MPATANEIDMGRIEHVIADHRGYLATLIRAKLDTRMSARLDVSDIVQEVQLDAVRRLESFKTQETLTIKQWLRKLACDRIVMLQRRHLWAEKRSTLRERMPTGASKVDYVSKLQGNSLTPSTVVSKRQESDRLHRAMAMLSGTDRDIIRMRVFEQMSGDDVAAILAIEPAAARQRFCRALIRLKTKLSTEV